MKPTTPRGALAALTLLATVSFTACNSSSSSREFLEPFDGSASAAPSDASSPTGEARTTSASAPKSGSRPSEGRDSSQLGEIEGSFAYPTGDPTTSALLLERFIPEEVQAGKQFEYTMRVTNLTELVLDDVTVAEDYSDKLVIASSEPALISTKPGSGVWKLGSMQPMESRLISVKGSCKDTDVISTCSTISYNAGLCMSVPVVQPALRLAASAPGEIGLCDDLEARFVVTNTGSGSARNVVVSAAFPEGMTTRSGARSFDMEVGVLEAGQSKTLEVPAKIARQGSFQYEATASASGGLSAKSDRLTTTVRRPVLNVTLSGPEKTFAGRKMRYEIQLENEGDDAAQKTVLEAALPAGCTVKKSTPPAKVSGRRVRWDIGELRPEQTRSFQLELVAEELGSYTQTVTAQAACADSAIASASTSVNGIPAILLEVVDVEDPVEVGAIVTYDLQVTNQGSADGHDVSLVATLPPNTSYVSADGPTVAKVNGQTVTFGAIAALRPGAKATWLLRVKGNSPGDSRFRVRLESDELTTPVDETEATYFYE